MSRLLIVHHTPSPATAEMLDAVVAGATDPDIEGVEVVRRAALAATANDLLAADAVVIGSTANIGYMSGAVKHWFDTVFYVCADDTRRLPYGVYVHGNSDLSGAVTSIDTVARALSWEKISATVEVTGAPDGAALAACRELGGVVAATIAEE